MPSELIPRAAMRTVSRVEGEFTMYAWHAVAVLVWVGPISVEGARQIHRSLAGLSVVEGPCSVVHLLHERVGLPSAEVRAEFGRLSKSHERGIVCTAILERREGFAAGAVKAVVTGLSVVLGVRLKIRIFTKLDELVAWVVTMHAAQTNVSLDATALSEVLQNAGC